MIKATNISKTYNGIHNVVDGLSLSVPHGSIFGFLGPNGAGKTTTMKMLVGINKPDSGEITIAGQSPFKTETRQTIGFMPEEPHFYNKLTGFEFLEFSSQLFKKRRARKELEEMLQDVGIYEVKDNKIATYSKGMKQRLGFAQVFVNDPEYIFLDEPLDGLDPIGRQEIKKMIEQVKNKGKTIFFNSHILSDVETLCDQIGIIHRGKLIYSGSVNEFKKDQPLEDRFVEVIKAQQNG